MPKTAKSSKGDPVLALVRKMRDDPESAPQERRRFFHTDPVNRKATRVFFFLRALEEQLLAAPHGASVAIEADPASDRLVVSINTEDKKTLYAVYLQPAELALIMKNASVARVLRKHAHTIRVA
jgi:hypothetical protein